MAAIIPITRAKPTTPPTDAPMTVAMLVPELPVAAAAVPLASTIGPGKICVVALPGVEVVPPFVCPVVVVVVSPVASFAVVVVVVF